jgi:lipopolysaccharide transport system ATP-binding protein
MSVAIKVENLSKLYRLGEIGTGTISRDMERWFRTRVLRQEDPFLRIGETNDRASRGESDIVYSLRDINFEINQGDAVGIIGRNGAGKSTLLKILSRVTTPTTGRINIKGRVASLLEVGTGFHPELTGRENIYLNGTILGMRKWEIDRKLDEIIDFSGVERYIDTPVKRYSSGMYVRLAFAVAAHLESEILIVDEVLAVGDAEFQKKCLGKIKDVSENEGRTILFVSHNMPIMQKLCTHSLLLRNGQLVYDGTMSQTIDCYLDLGKRQANVILAPDLQKEVSVLQVELQDEAGVPVTELPIGRKWKVYIRYQVLQPVSGFISAIGMVSLHDVPIRTSWQDPIDVFPGIYEAVFEEDQLLFSAGQYKITVGLSQGKRSIQFLENLLAFDIIPVVERADHSIIEYENYTGLLINQMKTKTTKI